MDSITFQIIRSAFYAIAREMKVVMALSSSSAVLHYGGDCSAALFDGQRQLVAQGNDIPTMLGSTPYSLMRTVEAVGLDQIEPGDVLLSNDPYLAGGNHLPDVLLAKPVFYQERLIGFACTRAHWNDVGGISPGSYTGATFDIYAEGLRIPPIRIYRRGVLQQDLANLVIANTREPDARFIDLQAQYAGAAVGEERLLGLVERYGLDTVEACIRDSLDYSERRIIAELQQIPDGSYRAVDYYESLGDVDGRSPVRIQVEVRKDGPSLTFDFTGTDPQARSGINSAISNTYSAVYYVTKALTSVDIPSNAGCFRPVRLIVPPGTVLNPVYPASTMIGISEVANRLVDTIFAALVPAIPDRVIAGSSGSGGGTFVGGLLPKGEQSDERDTYGILMDVTPGGYGAGPQGDGASATRVHMGNTGSQSVEVMESTIPVVVKEWSLVADSGGPGLARGGLASRKVFHIGFDSNVLNNCERSVFPAFGLFGGRPGAVGRYELRRGSEITRLPSKIPPISLNRGDDVIVQLAGGGGYGDPYRRPADQVRQDVVNGYVSRESAMRDYGVVLGDDLRVDEAATTALRAGVRPGSEAVDWGYDLAAREARRTG